MSSPQTRPDKEDTHVLKYLADFHYTIEPEIDTGVVTLWVKEWFHPDSLGRNPPVVRTQKPCKTEEEALALIRKLKLARRLYIIIQNKYAGMVL